jgi:hypothetical protein
MITSGQPGTIVVVLITVDSEMFTHLLVPAS